jgi:hypothetical protein
MSKVNAVMEELFCSDCMNPEIRSSCTNTIKAETKYSGVQQCKSNQFVIEGMPPCPHHHRVFIISLSPL